MDSALVVIVVLLCLLVVYFRDQAESRKKDADQLAADLAASRLVRTQMTDSQADEVSRLRAALDAATARTTELETKLAQTDPGSSLRDIGHGGLRPVPDPSGKAG